MASRLARDLLGFQKPKGKDDLAPEADDPPWPDVKVVVIVNKRSGSRVGQQLARKLVEAKCGVLYLDEYLRRRDALMAKLVSLVAEHSGRDDLRFVAAGGDGTVSWVAELVNDACVLVGTNSVPPIAILSLGTGNELARVTGWGNAYSGESLVPFVRDVASGTVVGVDSWLWRATPLDVDESGKPIDRPRANLRAPSRVVGPRALHDFEGGSPWGLSGEGVRDMGTTAGGTDGEGDIFGSARTSSGGVRDDDSIERGRERGRRLSVNVARRMAYENDDLPRLPTLAFAPPPLTPPGTRSSPHANPRRGKPEAGEETERFLNDTLTSAPRPMCWSSRSGASLEKEPANPTRSDALNDDAMSAPASRAAASRDAVSTSSRRGHARSGSFGVVGGAGPPGSALGVSPKYPTNPTNNGIGFGRRKNLSRGGSVDFYEADGFDDVSFDGSECDDDGDLQVVEKTSVCFFSVGFDASIALQFHQLRERTPCCADNVTKIVAGHAVLGFMEGVARRKYLRPGVMTLRVDGKEVAIPPGARTVQFFNIHSSATGIDFFGCDEKSTPDELQVYEPPNIGDGLIEIVATMSTWHLGAIRLGFGHSHRVAQGSSVEMVIRDAIPVQVDGEPWLQPPAVITVSARGKIPFVLGRGEKRNVPTAGHVRRPSGAIPVVPR